MSTYYNVTGIAGDSITVDDQNGTTMQVSKNIIEKMSSGTHFNKEVAMSMTALAELLENFFDTVFTVCFHKQATPESAKAALELTSYKDL